MAINDLTSRSSWLGLARGRKKKSKLEGKALINFRHARAAAGKRYRFEYTQFDERRIISAIKQKHSDGERVSHSRAVHILDYEGQKVKVVYDRARKSIVTFLPLEEG